jgi:septin family protein
LVTNRGELMELKFQKAVKHGAKLRLAVCGPSGSGKTYTLLKLATELGGPIAVVDTERGSASKYADIFEFDVLEVGSYDPRSSPTRRSNALRRDEIGLPDSRRSSSGTSSVSSIGLRFRIGAG